ncbi:Hypothetical_protein [Hexamita inflata]|uniref:Hypothetical_protein n=1 Tax=Hexamita inflata TaxID=28002 RepID=A0ABP1HZV0_9EUKA
MLTHLFPRTENLDDNILIHSEELQMLSKLDKTMIKTYQNQIKDGALRIQSTQDLKNLEFMRFLKITELQLYDCKNIIPKLESRTIKNYLCRNVKFAVQKTFAWKTWKICTLLTFPSQGNRKNSIVRFFKKYIIFNN